jgi:ribosomal protein S27AE
MEGGPSDSTSDSTAATAAETFATLGDETRLDIIRVLWSAGASHEYDDIDDSASVLSFSELRRRVDVGDNGRFNYHLSKLVPQFVRKTADGYRLSGGGRRLARTVVAVAGEQDRGEFGTLRSDCPICGAAVTASYEDEWLRFACTECDGLFGDVAPKGTLLNAPFPSPGLAGRSPDDALATELYRCTSDLTDLMQGVCPECASPVRGTLSVCDEHEPGLDGGCRACGTPFVAWGDLRCGSCRFAKRLPVELCVLALAPAIGFMYTQGINVLAPALDELFGVVQTRVSTAVTESPPGVVTTIDGDDDSLTVTLDEHLRVVDVSG